MKKYVKKYWEYMLAFMIPITIVLLHCIIRDSWLFGDGSILRGDANIQYLYLFEELWNKVHSGDFSFFSWNAIGGFDFYLNALYYAVSPATIIVLLLPKSCIEDALQFFIVIKWALLSFSAVYFFMHTKLNNLKKYKKLVSLTLGICYAMSTFCIFAITFFNWLDTMIVFPILLLLVEKMVEKRRWKSYYLFLTFAMCCNFYIAFPICLFLILWFFLQMQIFQKRDKKIFGVFVGTSLLSALSSCAVILPCVLNVGERYTPSAEIKLNEYLTSVVERLPVLISRFFAFGIHDSVATTKVYFYMSVGIPLLCMLYALLKMNRRIWFTKIFMVLFLFVSVYFGALNYVWHGFSIPHGYNPRFGFLLIFILAVMALDVFTYIEEIKRGQCIAVLGMSIAVFFYSFFNISLVEEFIVYIGTLFLVVFYGIMLFLLAKKSIKKDTFIVVVCVFCLLEICGNAYYQFSLYNVIKPEEVEYTGETTELAQYIELEDGERAVFPQATLNVGMQAQMPTMSGFVSYANGAIGDLHYALGMHAVEDAGVSYKGSSPLSNLLFNVKYGIGQYDVEFNEFPMIHKGDNLKIYEAEHTLGLGYMVDSSILDWNVKNVIPFDVQNEFLYYAKHLDEKLFSVWLPEDIACYTALGEISMKEEAVGTNAFGYQYVVASEDEACILKFTVDKDKDLYLNFRSYANVTIGVLVDGELVYRSSYKGGQWFLSLGKVKKGQKVSIVLGVQGQKGEENVIAGQLGELHEHALESIYEKLSHQTYQITDMQSDYIKGTIHVEEPGIMMTSIPAMKGFCVYVEGKEVEPLKIGDSLIGVSLDEGDYEVAFVYETPHAKMSWFLSLCGIILFVIICSVRRTKHASLFCETGATE